MKNLVILSVACAGLSAVRMAAAAEEPTTEIPLPTFERTPLDELLGNSTVHDGTEEWDWGGDTIPIVKNTRTGPLTTEELRNATHVAMDYKEAYLLFKKTYNRSYGDNAEEQRRYSYFVRNMASAFFNQTANPYATFGANNFSDMTPREFLPFHNLTDVSDDYLNKSAAYASTTKAPSATTIDGYDILHNAFDLSFALKDVNGEYSVLGQGNKFWGAAQAEGIASDLMAAEERRMAGADVNADETSDDDLAKTSSGAGGVKAAVSRVKKSAKSKILRGVKALRALLTSTRGDGKAQSDDADWVRIEEAYTVVKDSFASWDEQKEKSKEQADHETLQSAAKSFSELESEYLKMKKERKGSESEAVAPPSGTVVPPENPAVAEAVGRSFNAMAAMPQILDWRLYGAVTPVRNQGFCGGCWAFATAGNIEGVWRIAGKPLTQLSEQSLISCDTYSGNMGCGGGVPQYAYNFVIKYQNGLMSRLDYYPFSSGSGVAPLCTAAQQVAGAAINRYVSIARDENVIMQYVANIGPVTAAIDSISWQSYSGGIMTNCLGLSVDHAVLIVGYDNNFTVPYWIIKNSWGTDWGEKGYIRVAKGSNQCLITTNPSTALAAAAVTILDPTTTSPPTTTMNTTTPANTTTPTTPAGTTVVPVPEVTTQKDSTAKPATTQTATTTGPKLTIRPVTDTPIIDIPGGILDDVDKELSFAVRIPISTAFVGVLFVAAAFMA